MVCVQIVTDLWERLFLKPHLRSSESRSSEKSSRNLHVNTFVILTAHYNWRFGLMVKLPFRCLHPVSESLGSIPGSFCCPVSCRPWEAAVLTPAISSCRCCGRQALRFQLCLQLLWTSGEWVRDGSFLHTFPLPYLILNQKIQKVLFDLRLSA